ncbi:hypothetical protein DVB88_04805, partial [Tsukamurella pulmonis]
TGAPAGAAVEGGAACEVFPPADSATLTVDPATGSGWPSLQPARTSTADASRARTAMSRFAEVFRVGIVYPSEVDDV